MANAEHPTTGNRRGWKSLSDLTTLLYMWVLAFPFSRSTRRFVTRVATVACVLCFATSVLAQKASTERQHLVVYRIVPSPGRPPTPYSRTGEFLVTRLKQLLAGEGRKYDVHSATTDGSFDTLLKHESLYSWNLGESASPFEFRGFDRQETLPAGEDAFPIGIVQADVLFHYLNGGHPQFPFGRKTSSVRAIAQLFPEWVHLYCSPGSTELPLSLFQVACGDIEGSGSLVSAINLGRVLHADWADNLHGCDAESPGALHIRVLSPGIGDNSTPTRLPDGLVQRFMSTPEARIMENAFGSGVYSVVRESALRQRFYVGNPKEGPLERERATVSVDAILISSKDLPGEVVRALVEILNDLDKSPPSELDAGLLDHAAFTSYRSEHPRPDGKLSTRRTDRLPIAMHPKLKVLQTHDGLTRALIVTSELKWVRIGIVILGIALVALTYVRLRNRKSWRSFTTQKKIVRALAFALLFAIFHLLIAIMVWLSEYHTDSPQKETALATGTVVDAVDWIIRFVVMGESAHELRSNYSLMWLGFLKGGYILSAVFVSVAFWEYVMSKWRTIGMKNHVVVVGWNTRGRQVINELQSLKKPYQILLGSDHPEALASTDKETVIQLDDIVDGFGKANLRLASAVIVLADTPEDSKLTDEDSDLRVARVLGEVTKVIGPPEMRVNSNQSRSGPYVVAEVIDTRHVEIAYSMGADEVICVSNFGVQLLAQSATKMGGLISVYDELLHTSKQDNEVYFHMLSDAEIAHCKSFGGLGRSTAAQTHGDERIVVIGIRRPTTGSNKKRIILNPGHVRLCPGDEAIVLARAQPARLFSLAAQ